MMLLIKVLTLITAISFGHRVQSPKIPGYDHDYLYETTIEGDRFSVSFFNERERNEMFRGYNIFVEPIKRATARIAYETGPNGSDYQEFGYKERFFEKRKFIKMFGLNATVVRRTLGWDTKPCILTGVGLDNSMIKISYGTNWMSQYTFRVNMGTKFAVAALGKGFWYMPDYSYEKINGEASFVIKNSIGYEW